MSIIDTKAKVKVGDFSRGGEARGHEAVKARDHDMRPEAILVPFGVLELANLGWTTDDGKPALKFADNATGKAAFPKSGGLDLNYLRHPGYKGRDTLPVALAGHHGGGFELKAFTLVSWVKPDTAMGKSDHGGKGVPVLHSPDEHDAGDDDHPRTSHREDPPRPDAVDRKSVV